MFLIIMLIIFLKVAAKKRLIIAALMQLNSHLVEIRSKRLIKFLMAKLMHMHIHIKSSTLSPLPLRFLSLDEKQCYIISIYINVVKLYVTCFRFAKHFKAADLLVLLHAQERYFAGIFNQSTLMLTPNKVLF